MRIRSIAILALSVICLANVIAAPYVPESDGKVLERLPFKPNDPIARELADLRAALKRNPQDPAVAVKLASRYYEMVSQEGDPRYLGYAQAALGPWWDMAAPPTEVQVLRASLRQFLHDFAGAVNDLDAVLQREPQHSQARVLRAIIHIVQARYPLGMVDCKALRQSADPLIAQGCEAMVDGLTGKAADAYAALAAAITKAPSIDPEKRLWLELRLAELAERQGRGDVAETHFKRALALGIPDTFLLAAYADLLLEQNRPVEVLGLLKNSSRSDVLLLRLVFAERMLQRPTANELTSALAARYAAAQMRGETVHQQEEARFALRVENNPKKALALATENWKVQREPRDAEIFLQSALALKDAAAAKPVLNWLEESGIEDQRLIKLGQQLRGVRP
ncbi:tetratricopeptide repeat protein [Noviherbaspirillum saxi]|uniref:Tetratricopeptide repeat-containing protein n=1 Tax=Noviherbaspirillum saxi TaxID=2320863 RepID=A0A3A3FUD4_9BURK|nr:hypothetical protein [Noviherbaspirillum saxi]RJF99140.1 hypothetical protein D3871_11915 [Noviherbaspirillum saxi]